MLEIVSGDLLSDTSAALVNPVNCVGVMGKGLALQFKNRWPDCFARYAAVCARGELQPGKLHVCQISVNPVRYVINFPTKRHWRDASRIEDIALGLQALINTVRHYGMKSIALPALGCGLGGLRWEDVLPPLKRTSELLPGVVVRVYAPQGAVSVKTNPIGVRTTKQRPLDLVKMGKGKMVHIKHPEHPGTLCAPQREDREEPYVREFVSGIRPADASASVATCYRCIKVNTLNMAAEERATHGKR